MFGEGVTYKQARQLSVNIDDSTRTRVEGMTMYQILHLVIEQLKGLPQLQHHGKFLEP